MNKVHLLDTMNDSNGTRYMLFEISKESAYTEYRNATAEPFIDGGKQGYHYTVTDIRGFIEFQSSDFEKVDNYLRKEIELSFKPSKNYKSNK